MTAGGSESILMAVKAYRDWARTEKGITNPNLVAPRTAHPAFDKACQYFGVNLRKVDEDTKTWRADTKAMAKAVDRNTIAVVGSCPQYPHGCVDPIKELSDLAVAHKIGLHVDCCLGSYLDPFMKKAGFKFPDFDFVLPGVTTISCDTHKYGYSPKGSSVLMFKTAKLRSYMYSIFPDWPGGIYGTPTAAGSRSGALIAATWAALMYHGEDKYLANTKAIIKATRKMAVGIEEIEGLKLMCQPDVSVVCWTSDVFDINRVTTGLVKEKGWDVNVLQFPPSIHIAVTMAHTREGVIENFLSDLAEVTAPLFATPKVKATGGAAMYGMAQAVPDRTVIEDIVSTYIDTMLLDEVPAASEQ